MNSVYFKGKIAKMFNPAEKGNYYETIFILPSIKTNNKKYKGKSYYTAMSIRAGRKTALAVNSFLANSNRKLTIIVEGKLNSFPNGVGIYANSIGISVDQNDLENIREIEIETDGEEEA